MDQPAPLTAPYFDFDLLRQEAAELAHSHSGQDSTLRMALLERLRRLVEEARTAARRQLERDGDGRACAEGLSAFQDALIRLAFEFTTTHVYRADNPSIAERMAVVAQGGYGRGLLAPGSDIDLLFLLPYKQTAWGESVAEYMLYLLWDLGFKVGHATRNIDQCIRLSLSDMTIRTALLDSRLLLGDEALYADFHHRFRKEVLEGNARPLIGNGALPAEPDFQREVVALGDFAVGHALRSPSSASSNLKSSSLSMSSERSAGITKATVPAATKVRLLRSQSALAT